MSARHTPGPWKWSVESVDPEWAIVTDQSGGIVANVNSETGPDGTSFPAMRLMPRDANARLIAAAPALLEALSSLMPWIDKAIESGAFKECVLPRGAEKAAEAARAALAQATGSEVAS